MAVEFSSTTRRRNLERLSGGLFDLLVVGCGVTGAGIARDAALRGLSVSLVDLGDFGSGTSSRSSRLIHGGFRYLSTLDFRLVFESCRERHRLRMMAPHLARPVEILYPFYGMSGGRRFWRSLGLRFYDFLALYRNVKPHRMLRPAEALRLEPAIRRDALTGAASFHDCLTNDARLALANVKAAHRLGAVAANYCQVVELHPPNQSIRRTTVEDTLSGDRFDVRSRWVVNAGGPWLDHVRRLADPAAACRLAPSLGTHLVVERARLGMDRGLLFHSPDDGRLLVAVPFGPTALVGTTELPWDGRDWFAVPDEIGYLLRAINAALPDARLEPADVWCAFTGVRPLLRSPRGSLTEASRQHGLFIESEGLLSIGGGKLTTYRAMAEETVNTIACQLGRTIRPCQTGEIPLEEVAAPSPEEAWNPPAHRGFRSRSDMDAIRALAARESFLGRPIVDGLPYPFAEVLFALQEEMAMTLEDILVRRTPVFYEDRRHGLGRLNEVVELAGRFLGWDEGMRSAEAARYREFVQRSEPDRSPSAGRA